MKNIAALAIIAASSLFAATSSAKDYNTVQVIDSQHMKAVPFLLPAGRTHFSMTGTGPMSCAVVAPDTKSFPNGRVLGGQLASDSCSFDVRVRTTTFVVLIVESDEPVEGVERVFTINVSH